MCVPTYSVIIGPISLRLCCVGRYVSAENKTSAEIVGSNPSGGMDVSLLWVSCAFRYRSLLRADHSSRGLLPNVVSRCAWSRNLVNEEALAHWAGGGLSHQKQRNCRFEVLTPETPCSLVEIYRYSGVKSCWNLHGGRGRGRCNRNVRQFLPSHRASHYRRRYFLESVYI